MSVNYFAEAFAWCMLQVTLFSLLAACVYGVMLRSRFGSGAFVLFASLVAVGLITLLSFSPWPRWNGLARADVAVPSTQQSTPALALGPRPDSPPPLAPNRIEIGDAIVQQPRELAEGAAGAELTNAASRSELATRSWPNASLVLVSFAGIAAAIGLGRLVGGVICLWQYCRGSRPIDDPALHELLVQLSQSCKVGRSVELRESASLRTAATAGWRRPLILLPAAWRDWSPEEHRAVLAHELAHVAERHFPVWAMCQLPLVAHYYHPLVHWLVRRLRWEHEITADELAASVYGRGRHQYATVLAGLALRSPAPRSPFASLGLFMSRPFLMRRLSVLRQTKESQNRSSRKSRVFVLVVLGVAAAAVAGIRSSQGEESAQPGANANRVVLVELPTVDTPPADAPPVTPLTAVPQSPVPPTVNVAPYRSDIWSQRPAAVALFQVSRTPPSLVNTESEPESDEAWQVLCKTQLAKLRSHYVLQTAIRVPGIAELPILKSLSDPVDWLAEQLEVGFMHGSEIMYIRLTGDRSQIDQLIKLVDAVAKAYEDEAVYADTQRQLTTRDLLAANLKSVNEDLNNKMELYYANAKEQGVAETPSGRVAQEIDLKRLDRIETELMRLENAQLELETSGQSGNKKFYEQRIAELGKRQKELEESIMARSQMSVDLASRLRDIEQLQRIANGMALKLEVLDVDAKAPSRIRKIQNAVPTGIGAPAVSLPEVIKTAK